MKSHQLISKIAAVTPERVIRSARYRTMRILGRLDTVRDLLTPPPPRRRADLAGSFLPDVRPERVAVDLRVEGLYEGLRLPDSATRSIREWALGSPCFGDMNPKWGFRRPEDREKTEAALGHRFTIGYYFNVALECPEVARLESDPVLREIARHYVGGDVRHVATGMWWSYVTDVGHDARHQYAQMYHYDLDDYKFIKVFFYLSDVDEGSGPHVYVRGTHRGKALGEMFPMRRFSDAEVEGKYGRNRVCTLTGPAGTGFVEDTFGLHKGTPPRTRDRLAIEVEFARSYYHGGDRVDPSTFAFVLP